MEIVLSETLEPYFGKIWRFSQNLISEETQDLMLEEHASPDLTCSRDLEFQQKGSLFEMSS